MIDLEKLVREVELGDDQRNARFLDLAVRAIQGVSGSREGAQGPGHDDSWAHAMGAFRFWKNEALTLPALYQPCRRALPSLIPTGARAFVCHDLSVLDYSGHNAKHERIPIGDHRGMGFELYSALVLNDKGRPLGPVAQELRCDLGCLSSESTTPLSATAHLDQVERGFAAAQRHLPGRELIHLYDREFDDVLLQRRMVQQNATFVMRAQHLKRRIRSNDRPCSLAEAIAPVKLTPTAEVVVREGHKKTRFELWIGETTVVFDGESWRGRHREDFRSSRRGDPITLRVVVSELRPVDGGAVQRWVLLTNSTLRTEEVAQAYVWRWRVERLFFLVKVGFRLEDWRQESAWGIARRLAVTSLSAMVIYQLRNSADPEHEQTLEWIARRGGWVGKKGVPIGPIVLMRGLNVLLAALTLLEHSDLEVLRHHARVLRRCTGIPLAEPRP